MLPEGKRDLEIMTVHHLVCIKNWNKAYDNVQMKYFSNSLLEKEQFSFQGLVICSGGMNVTAI